MLSGSLELGSPAEKSPRKKHKSVVGKKAAPAKGKGAKQIPVQSKEAASPIEKMLDRMKEKKTIRAAKDPIAAKPKKKAVHKKHHKHKGKKSEK